MAAFETLSNRLRELAFLNKGLKIVIEDIALLFSLVAGGQIKLRRIDGWRKITAVLSQQRMEAA